MIRVNHPHLRHQLQVVSFPMEQSVKSLVLNHYGYAFACVVSLSGTTTLITSIFTITVLLLLLPKRLHGSSP
jgi:hypothetical protein